MSMSPATRDRVSPTIWILGWVSLLMDLSSELIHALLPLFLVTTLGVSVATVGIIEGMAEATASIAKVFAGALSDRIGRRKPLLMLGYGLAALTKPLFPLASTVALVAAARFMDRVGKGIRGAPRDALVSDVTPPASRGAAYGLRQSLDTVGAFLGPLLAIALMLWLVDDIRSVMWFAVPPALLAVGLLAIGLSEPEPRLAAERPRFPISRSELARLDASYWWVVTAGSLFTLARFSEAFLLLRARETGLPLAWTPLVMLAMTAAYSASAYPAGLLADRVDRRHVLALGAGLLIAADLVLASAAGVWGTMVGAAIWGLHMGFTQGLLAALVADTAPEKLRGTAFGMFNLITGAVLLLASALAGYLWDQFGAAVTFLTGAAFTGLSLLVFVIRRPPAVDES
jgi:MFS family permease